MKLQVETHSHSVSNVSLDSEKVEGLCFPLLFCHGEPGYTNDAFVSNILCVTIIWYFEILFS